MIGDTLAILKPFDGEPLSTSSFAAWGFRNSRPVAAFDAATDTATVFSSALPRYYSGNGLTVSIYWAGATATSGNVVWDASFERVPTLDIDADSFATAVSAQGTANATSGILTVTEIAFTNSQIDGLAAGEAFRLKINRDANNASDTMTGDAQLYMVEIRES